MPKAANVNLEEHKLPGSHYGYSATKVDKLTATEYTLVTIALDESGSTAAFKSQMEECIKRVIQACRYSPRADNLMIRLTAFGTHMREVHGYKLLEACNVQDYDGCYGAGGQTALYDSAENAIRATASYAQQLSDNDFSVNAIVFVLTDGDDNSSTFGQADVKKALQDCVNSEAMESMVSVLIGVNIQDPTISQYLDDFNNNAGFTRLIQIADASEKSLAKVAEFVSKSISSQSGSLNKSNQGSQQVQSLTF